MRHSSVTPDHTAPKVYATIKNLPGDAHLRDFVQCANISPANVWELDDPGAFLLNEYGWGF